MRIIYNRKKRKALSRNRFTNWAQRHRIFQLIVIVAVMGVTFLMGVLVPEQGWIKQLPGELGIGLRERNLAIIMESLVGEPTIAINALLNAPEIPTINIDMKFKSYNQIEKKRERSLQRGVLLASDDDFVPAEIRFQGKTIKVKMRLKGDLPDHRETDKWSYRIQVKNDEQLLGMRRFSIQHPKTRNFLSEKALLDNFRMEGILAPRFRFVNVVFNGTPKGIFALEESFSKELIESHERREGVIIAFDEDNYWQRWEQLGQNPWFYDSIYSVGYGGYKNGFIEASRSSRIDGDPILSKERDTAIGLLRAFQENKRTGSELFDASLLGRFLAINELWQSEHALLWTNIHFYYNPVTAKLEPIGFDGDAQKYDDDRLHALSVPWTIQALQDPVIAEVYVRELDRMSRPDYLEQMRAELDEPLEQLQLALHSEFPFVRSARLWEILEKRLDYIRRLLGATDMVLAFADIGFSSNDNKSQGSASSDTLQIEVRNILALPVEVVGFQVGSSFIPADIVWTSSEGQIYTHDGQSSVLIPRHKNNAPQYALFHLPVDAPSGVVSDGKQVEIKVITRLLGLSTTHTTPVRQYPPSLTLGPMPRVPTVPQALAQYPFLEQGETEDILVVRQGEWHVNGDLVLPQGVRLQAGPGTTLRFAHDAIFISTAPLEFRGTAEAPVVLAPQDSSWSGMVVLEAEESSVWEYVVVENTHGIEREGWVLTGGITFYKSPILLVHSRILGSEAEDGLNIIRSKFEIRNSEFSKFASDAFDGDFTKGVIHASNFHDVTGDAIDVSGSQVQLSDVILGNIGDKALSAGEESQIDATDIVVVNTGIGVASKDLSEVRLERVTIKRAIHAGLAAYMKKLEYGPASITAVDIDFRETPQKTLVQLASWIDLDNTRIEGTDIDVKKMYEAGILGN